MAALISKTLAILAGGKSSRMNYQNKAFIAYKEKQFIEHIIEAGRDFEEMIIVTNQPEDYQKYNLKTISDIFPGNGPLSGIHVALKAAKNEEVLCIACDMPLTSREVLYYLGEYVTDADVLVPLCDDRLQPLCAVYHKRLLTKMEKCLKNQDFKLQKFILSANYEVLKGLENRQFVGKDFFNVNTPTDLLELEEI